MGFFRRLLAWLLPAVVYAFRCILCGLVELLTQEAATAAGWRYDGASRGWCCPGCAGASVRPGAFSGRPT